VINRQWRNHLTVQVIDELDDVLRRRELAAVAVAWQAAHTNL
jgi:hypothetical protein